MNKPGNPLPDAEQLLARLLEQMQPVVKPDTGIIGIHTGGVWVAERLHAAASVRTQVLPRCGHWTPVERAQECAALWQEFVASAARTSSPVRARAPWAAPATAH